MALRTTNRYVKMPTLGRLIDFGPPLKHGYTGGHGCMDCYARVAVSYTAYAKYSDRRFIRRELTVVRFSRDVKMEVSG